MLTGPIGPKVWCNGATENSKTVVGSARLFSAARRQQINLPSLLFPLYSLVRHVHAHIYTDQAPRLLPPLPLFQLLQDSFLRCLFHETGVAPSSSAVSSRFSLSGESRATASPFLPLAPRDSFLVAPVNPRKYLRRLSFHIPPTAVEGLRHVYALFVAATRRSSRREKRHAAAPFERSAAFLAEPCSSSPRNSKWRTLMITVLPRI